MQQPNMLKQVGEDGEEEQNEYFDDVQYELTTETDFHVNDEIIMLSQKTKKMIYKFAEEIPKYKQLSNQILNGIIDLIQECIEKIKQGVQQLKYESCDQEKNCKNSDYLYQINKQIKDKLAKFLEEQQTNNNNDFTQLFEILKNENTQNDKNFFKKYKRKYLIISTIRNKDFSSSFEFNQRETILFVQTKGNIKLFGFNSRRKLIKTLPYYQNFINQLIWMKKQQLLLQISNRNFEVIIWSNQWIPNQIFQSTQYGMNCIIMNEKEDIITGSENNIQFWPKSDLYKSPSQTIDTLVTISDLGLNPEQKKLLAGGIESHNKNNQDHYYYLIYIIEMKDLQRVVTQIIRFLQFSDGKLYFTNNNQFVFQNCYQGFLQIFNYEYEKKSLLELNQFIFQIKWLNVVALFNLNIQKRQVCQLLIIKNLFIFFIQIKVGSINC